MYKVAAGLMVGVVLAFTGGSASAGAGLPALAPTHAPLTKQTVHGTAKSGCHIRLSELEFDHVADTVTATAVNACDRHWDRKVTAFTLWYVIPKGTPGYSRHLIRLDHAFRTFGPASAGRDRASVTLDCSAQPSEWDRIRVRAFGLVQNDGHADFHGRAEQERASFTC